jgi:O-antigen ligase
MVILSLMIPFLLFKSLLSGRFRFRFSVFHLLLVLLFFVYSIGALTAIAPIRVIRVCVLYIFLFLLFTITLELLNDKKRIEKATVYFLAVGVIGSLYGIYQIVGFILGFPTQLPFIENLSHHQYYFTGLTAFKLGGVWFPRINSTFNDPALIGGYVVMSLMILISLFGRRYVRHDLNFKHKLGYLSFSFVLLSCVILTFSRSSWIGACFGFAVLSYYLFKNSRTRKPLVVLLLFFSLVITWAIVFYSPFWDATIGRVMQAFDPTDISTSGHLKWLNVAIQAWSNNPILGVGLNNFAEYYAVNFQETNKAMTHSAYFSFLAETGIIGLILEMTFIFLIIRHLLLAISITRKSGDTNFYFLLVGILAAYVAMLGTNITYHFYTQFYVWFFNALAVAASTLVIKNPNRNYSVAS